MNRHYPKPSLVDLPPGRLQQRKLHLLAEIRTGDVERGRRWMRPLEKRRLVVVSVTLALIAALIAGPALGLRSTILGLFGRTEVRLADAPPASSIVRRDFADMASGAPKGMDPQVIPGAARIASTFDFDGSERRIWVAPTMTGSFCYVIEGVSGGCHSPHAVRQPLELAGGFVVRAGSSTPAMEILAGKIFDQRAVTLRVTFEDGRRMTLPFVYVSEPINAGFFAYQPTRLEHRPAHRPATIVLLDADGAVRIRQVIDWENETRKAENAIRARSQSG